MVHDSDSAILFLGCNPQASHSWYNWDWLPWNTVKNSVIHVGRSYTSSENSEFWEGLPSVSILFYQILDSLNALLCPEFEVGFCFSPPLQPLLICEIFVPEERLPDDFVLCGGVLLFQSSLDCVPCFNYSLPHC